MQNNLARIIVCLCCEASSVKYDVASLHFQFCPLFSCLALSLGSQGMVKWGYHPCTEPALTSCCCYKMSSSSAPAKQSHWSSSLCQFKGAQDAYPALWKGWQVIWGRRLAWTSVSSTEGRERTALRRSFWLVIVISFWLEKRCFLFIQ